MAPGFALILLAVALAGLAPIVLLVAVSCMFRSAIRQTASRSLAAGFVAGLVVTAGFAALRFFLGADHAESIELLVVMFVILFGAGFTMGGLAFSVLSIGLGLTFHSTRTHRKQRAG